MQINSGNGILGNCLERIKIALEESKAKILIISESNFDTSCQSQIQKRNREFPGYNFEDKKLTGSSVARISIFVCKSLEYERKLDCENDVNSTIVLRIQFSTKTAWTNFGL